MDHTEVEIGVVIVTYNNEATIKDCMASVMRSGIGTITVIDSNSSDATLAAIPPNCDVVSLAENKGFSYAANIGFSRMNTKYVLFLNPDTVIAAGAIHALWQTLNAKPRAGIVGGLLVNADGIPEQDAFGDEPTLMHIVKRHIIKTPSPHNNVVLVDWVSGGALLVRSDVFRSLGGFDEGFFLYWEDVDLCRRFREAGYGVYVNKMAKIQHIRGGSGLSLKKKTALYDQSANRYFHKYHHPLICSIHQHARNLYRLLRPLVR